ncbi:tetratricopeptide repeat-containing sensor histidine kinase [Mucilaginibacter sp. HMF5004]|uniref:ATP-binding protein n=1 Tax=Mucilaginibacter rivuli TaxID=2857527 RepID=UPI001C5F9101|nr:ATP-binding protein [Mucilaginibacter rivuli]MBW4890051.1 tetratricopeptide repeat-containing sensor histidine kinase [Mucilaginibacter rivuli]
MMDKYCKNYLKSAFLLVLLQLSVFLCFAQLPQSHPPVNPNSSTLTIPDYDKLIAFYRYYKPDSAIYFSNKAILLAKKNRDDIGLAKILNQVGIINDNLGKTDESRENYLEARKLYTQTGFKSGIATEDVRLGVVEMRKGNYDKAMGYFLESLKVSESINNAHGKMEAYLTIGECYLAEKKFDLALQNLKISEELDKTIPFSNFSLNLYIDFGILYTARQDYDQAISYLQKGIRKSDIPQYQGLNITLTTYLAAVYAKQGYKDRSLVLLKSALVKARAINNYIRELQTLTSIADTYGKGDPVSALVYLKQANELIKARGSERSQIDILGRMADMYHIQKNESAAYAIKEQQYAIADKYYYQKMAKQINSLQSAYDLNQSQANVQALKFENSRSLLVQRIVLVIAAGAFILLFVMVLFYFRTRKLNALLNKANTELVESNTVKDKLFSVLAHDLRSPFASIISLLSLINDDILDAKERKEIINMAVLSSNASLDILNNLLKWGEMQIKGIRLTPVILLPYDIIERNIALLSASAELKSISIINTVNKGCKVLTDADHFEFVIRNLLSNAIKFTSDGGTVSVAAQIVTEKCEAIFSIQDTGVGIEPQRLQSIFSLGNVSTSGTNDEKGTSLGLVLCKEFIEANRGRIWAESVPGKGSTFMFALKIV